MQGWFQIRRAADYADVSPRTFRTWIKEKGLKHSRVGGLVLVKVEDIDEFLEGFSETKNHKIEVDNLVDETLRNLK